MLLYILNRLLVIKLEYFTNSTIIVRKREEPLTKYVLLINLIDFITIITYVVLTIFAQREIYKVKTMYLSLLF